MGVLVGIVVVCALTVTMAATLFTNRVTWDVWRDQRREWRELAPDRRRRARIHGAYILIPLLVWLAVVFIAPWGTRHTLTYLVILPLVVIGPLATIAVGIRAARRSRRAGSGTIRRR
ncbi:MAG TPA: hypothetical protein VHV28_18070 [Solirubrobacteraceae bacterium]|jgi:hypothetical protein|nr:hypothetical protein [Solirubrobacteraceae bacterium]